MKSVDERIVDMQFNNKQFEDGIQTSLKSLDSLKKGLDDTGKNNALTGLKAGVDTIAEKFSALGIIGVTALQNITTSILDAGFAFAKSITTDPIMSGLEEYETKMNAITTILTNTRSKGTTLDEVNSALAELNLYADKTIYNFADMTRNVGTFTAAGVRLDDSVGAIKGIANLAAGTGSNAQQASTAMYQLSQALAEGRMSVQSWNSVVNAGMGGELFQTALIDKALEFGEILKEDAEAIKSGSITFRDAIKASATSAPLLNITKDIMIGVFNDFAEDDALVKAATQVKTFTQLLSTMREAVQSGWAVSWENIIGDREEAIELFTAISQGFEQIMGASADARNEMLSFWKENGGRDAIITALSNAFHGLQSAIKPVTDAFKQIFPPMTGAKLVELSKGIRDLSENFKMGDETADKVKRTFAGLFALLDIGKQAFGFLLEKAGALVGVLAPGAGGLLTFTANLGDMIVKLNDAIRQGDLFNVAFDNLKNFILAVASAIKTDLDGLKSTTGFQTLQDLIEKAADAIKGSFDKIKDVFSGWGKIDVGGLKDLTDNTEKHFRPFTAIGKGLSAAFDLIKTAWDKVKPVFETLATIVGNAFKSLSDAIGGAFDSGGISGVVDLLNGGLFAALLYGIKTFIDGLTDITSGTSGILDGITDILDGVKRSLEAYQVSLKADTLLKIGGAIALLAGSIAILATIDGERLATSLGAITVLFIELSGSMILIQKAMGGGTMGKVSGAMIAMSSAILILSVAMKSLAELDWDGITKGAAGIGILMLELKLFMENVKGDKLMSTGIAMIAIATAMNILVGAVRSLGELDIETLLKGVGSLGIILAEFVAFINLIDPQNLISTGIAMIAIGSAMLILSNAVANLGSLDIETLAKGLSSMAIILGEIGLFATLIQPQNLISTGIAMIAIGSAMLIFAEAVGKMGGFSVEEIAKGLITMASALGVIVAATILIPADVGIKAAGLLILSTALVVLSQAMENLGDMSWEEIAKSLVALAGSLTVITTAMIFMEGGLPGAAAMLVMSAAIGVLTPAIMALGSMDLAEIGTALIALVGVFVVVGGAAVILAPLTPVILALAAAIALLGVGVLGIGAGLLAFSAGLTALAVAGTAGAAAFVVVVTSLLSLIPMAIEKLGEGVILFAKVIAEGMPAIMEAVSAIFTGLIKLLDELIPPLLDVLFTFIDETLVKLVEYVPKFVDSGMKILAGFLKGIADNIQDVVEAAIDIVINLIKGITKKIPDVVKEAVALMAAFIKAIGEETPKLVAAGFQMIIDFINGLADTIREKTPLLVEAIFNLAGAIIEGLTNGLIGGVKSVITTIKDIGGALINGFKSILGINSPSTIFFDFAGNILQGLINGLVKGVKNAVDKIKEVGSSIIDGFKNVLGIHSPSTIFFQCAGNIIAGIVQGLVAGKDKVDEGATALGNNLIGSFEKSLGSNKASSALSIPVGKAINGMIKDIAEGRILAADGASDLGESVTDNFANSINPSVFTNPIGTAVGNMIKKMVDSKSSTSEGAKSLGYSITGNFEEILGSKSSYSALSIPIGNAVGNMIKKMVDSKPPVSKEAVELGNAVLDPLKETAKNVIPVGKEIVANLAKTLAAGVTTVAKSARDLGRGVLDVLTDTFKGIDEVADGMVQGFIKGLRTSWKSVNAEMGVLSQSTLDTSKDALGINSPSTEMIEQGMFSGKGFVIGLHSMLKAVRNMAGNLGDAAVNMIHDSLTKVLDKVNSEMDLTPVIKPIVDTTEVQNGINLMRKMLSSTSGLSINLATSALRSTTSHQDQQLKQQPLQATSTQPQIINRFDLSNMVVRSEEDIESIATRLYLKQQGEMRSRGLASV